MKRISIIILSTLYFILSTGIIITIHYCHDHISDFKVYGTFDDGCCESSCEISHECCTFDTISGKITQEHISSYENQSPSAKEIVLDIFSFKPDLEEELNSETEILSWDSSPPEDISLLYCSLTFYG